MSRSSCPTRAESGSSRCASRSCPSNSPRKPAQPAPPAFGIAADHRRVDDQLFPPPRRPQRTGDDHVVVVRQRAADGPSSSSSSGGGSTRAKPVTASSAGSDGLGRARGLARRPAPVRATGIRRTGSPTGARPRSREWREMPGPPGCGRRAPRSNQPGNAGAIEGVFEQADVVGRCCAAPPQCRRSAPRRGPPAGSGAQFRRTRGSRPAPRTPAPRRSARVPAAAGRRTGCGGAP